MSTFFIDRVVFDIDWLLRHSFAKLDNETNGSTSIRDLFHSRLKRHFDNQQGHELKLVEFKNKIRKEDLSYHLRSSTPFVIRGGASHWPALYKWDYDYFTEHFHDLVVPLVDNNTSGSELKYDTLGNAISNFKRGSSLNCKFADLLYRAPVLQSDLKIEELEKFKPLLRMKGALQFFIGPGNTKTCVHCAPGHNFFTQVKGEKLWRIYPRKYTELFKPKITRSPHFIADDDFHFPNENPAFQGKLDYWKVHLKPGDILFNPSYLWHCVENLSDSIAVKSSWVSAGSFMRNPLLSFMTLGVMGVNFLKIRKNLDQGDFFPEKNWF